MVPQTEHPDRDFWKAGVERIGNIATTDEKQDAVAHTSVEAQEEVPVKIAETSFEEKTDAEKKLVRKIDLYLMPTIWILYCFSYMVQSMPLLFYSRTQLIIWQDRTAIGNAKVAGMDVDLGLTSDEYFLAIVIFQVGYVFFEVPSKYAQRSFTARRC
jgi:hypothetical protein